VDKTSKKESGQNRKKQEQDLTGSKKSLEERRKLAYSLDLRGKNNIEIAEQLGVSLSTVEKDLHWCREHVRDWFSEIGSTERYCVLVDALIHFKNVKRDLWTLYYKEKDNLKASNLLCKIAEIVVKENNLYKTPESLLTDFHFKKKDLTKEYKLKEKFMDSIHNRI